MASILILPDLMLGAVGAHLPLYSAIVTSRVCRRLHAVFPAVLPRRGDGAHTHPIWIRHGRQLPSIAQWSRAYALSARCNMSWLTDACAAELGDVHTLDLSGTKITDVGVAVLCNVHTLNLIGTKVTDVGASALGNVHTLDLCGTEVTDVGAAALGNVHTLNLSHTGVTDVGVAALGNVHTLSLRDTKVTDVGASALCNVHTLNLL